MKRQLKYLLPVLFGILSFLFYMLLYHPVPESVDFVTALLVLCAAMTWSAVILFDQRGNPRVLNLYLSVFFLFPLILLLFLRRFSLPLHWAAIGLIVLAIVGLRLFIHYYFKYEKKS
jgi:hypothetical protein